MHLKLAGVRRILNTRIGVLKRESTPEHTFVPLNNCLRLSWMLKSIYEKQEGIDLGNVLIRGSLANLNPPLSTSGDPSSSTVPTHNTELDTRVSVDINRLEDIAIQFLSSYSRQPNWSQTLSFPNEYGQTLAHISTMFGCVQLLHHLITWGIDLNVPDVTGTTALHCAYLTGDVACASLMIRSGVNQLVLDDLGRSPAEVGPSMLNPKFTGRETAGGYSPFAGMHWGCYDTEMIAEDSARADSLLVRLWALQVDSGRAGGSSSPTISEQSLRGSDIDICSQVSCVGINPDSRLVLMPQKRTPALDIIHAPLAEATNNEPLLGCSRMAHSLILPSPPRPLPSYVQEGTSLTSGELVGNDTSQREFLPHTTMYQRPQDDDQSDCDRRIEFEDGEKPECSPPPVGRAPPSPVTSSADIKTAQLPPVLPPGLFVGRGATKCGLGSRYSTPGPQEYFGQPSSEIQIRHPKTRTIGAHGAKLYSVPVPAARGRRRGR